MVTTETVEQTTTRQIILPSPTTTSSSSSSSETPAWVWVLLAILAVGLVIVIVLLARRGGKDSGVSEAAASPAGRRGRRFNPPGLGARESDRRLRRPPARAAERMIVSVDAAGHLFTQPYSAGPPA